MPKRASDESLDAQSPLVATNLKLRADSSAGALFFARDILRSDRGIAVAAYRSANPMRLYARVVA